MNTTAMNIVVQYFVNTYFLFLVKRHRNGIAGRYFFTVTLLFFIFYKQCKCAAILHIFTKIWCGLSYNISHSAGVHNAISHVFNFVSLIINDLRIFCMCFWVLCISFLWKISSNILPILNFVLWFLEMGVSLYFPGWSWTLGLKWSSHLGLLSSWY